MMTDAIAQPGELEAGRVADPHAVRLACPLCGGTVLRERLPADALGQLVRASCAYCDGYRQSVRIGADGSAATVADPLLARARAVMRGPGSKAMRVTPSRPRCQVTCCRHLAAEGGLCAEHRTLWSVERQEGRTELGSVEWGAARGSAERSDECGVMNDEEEAGNLTTEVTDPRGGHGGKTSSPKSQVVEISEQPDKEDMAMAKQESDRDGLCVVKGCERARIARGVCNTHYGRWMKAGKPADVVGWARTQEGVPVRGGNAECGMRNDEGAGERSEALARQARKAARRALAAGEEREEGKPAGAVGGGDGDAPEAAGCRPGFVRMAIPTGMAFVDIGLLGRFITVTDADGRVVQQVPVFPL